MPQDTLCLLNGPVCCMGLPPVGWGTTGFSSSRRKRSAPPSCPFLSSSCAWNTVFYRKAISQPTCALFPSTGPGRLGMSAGLVFHRTGSSLIVRRDYKRYKTPSVLFRRGACEPLFPHRSYPCSTPTSGEDPVEKLFSPLGIAYLASQLQRKGGSGTVEALDI